MEAIQLLVFWRGSVSPFVVWLEGLRDRRAVAAIQARLNRVRLGNFGDCKSVGGGVEELRIDFGPGYRVYFGRSGRTVVVLLGGGSKRTQKADIRNAQRYWKEMR